MASSHQVLEFHEVTPERWSDFETLFESRGGPKACWCMVWRPLKHRAKADNAAKKSAMQRLILTETPVGLLGYDEGAPVAWCSVAPRRSYRSLGGPAAIEGEAVWSLACMFVKRSHRGAGVSRQLIEQAIEHARRRGAHTLEAYPVDPESPSYRFMGLLPVFVSLGFQPVGRAGSRRHVVQLSLGA